MRFRLFIAENDWYNNSLTSPGFMRLSFLPSIFSVLTIALLLASVSACARNAQRVTDVDRVRVAGLSRVAVLPLENLTEDPLATTVIAEMLSDSLYMTGRFSVMQHTEMVRRLADQNRAMPTAIDRLTAIEVGRSLGVDGIFFGTVLEYGYLFFPEQAVVGVQLRLVDTETGSIIWSGMANRSSEDVPFERGRPLNAVAERAIQDLAAHFSPQP